MKDLKKTTLTALLLIGSLSIFSQGSVGALKGQVFKR
jgi:hypothetical protein